MLEQGSAAMPAHRLALSAHPAPLVFVFLLLVGSVGLFPLFAASCPLSSDHCSFSHQILEFNPKANKQGTEKREDNKCIPHFNVQWLPWVCFGILIVTPWKICSYLFGIIILYPSYAGCACLPLNSLDRHKGGVDIPCECMALSLPCCVDIFVWFCLGLFFFLSVDNSELPKVSACNNDHICMGICEGS